jgi:hypothetical protein
MQLASSLRDGAYAGEIQSRRPPLERRCGLATGLFRCTVHPPWISGPRWLGSFVWRITRRLAWN